MTQAELMTFCSKVMGSDLLARDWMTSPALALDHQRPGDLMDTVEGRDKIEVLLTRLEYGVYT